MHKSCWQETEKNKYKTLNNNLETDILIIGGGMCGILNAYELRNSGFKITLIDGNEIGSGVTSHTTAKITSQHDILYDKLFTEFGEDIAFMYAESNESAIKYYEEIIKNENINCDFNRVSSYIFAELDRSIKKIEKEYETTRKLKINSFLVDDIELPIEIKCALEFKNQAQFNPLKFLYKISNILVESGVNIFEETKALDIEDNVVLTNRGKIKAKEIIVCTHFPFLKLKGLYPVKMYQEKSYVIAVKDTVSINGNYISCEENGKSFRNYKDLTFIGGEGHKTGKNKIGDNYDNLEKYYEKYFNMGQIKYKWSAQDCMTHDSMPYIGRYTNNTPHLYVATGFKKWGMTSSMVSAKILSELILEGKSKWEDVYNTSRLDILNPSVSLFSSVADSVKALTSMEFKIPKTHFSKLPNGHGGIVEYKGTKIGVYKDLEGNIFAIDPKCTHLGCEVAFNPAELNWECPCHGSRYDIYGNVLDNPTLLNLKKIDLVD